MDEAAFARAHRRLMTRRLPLFTVVWTGTSVVWVAALVLQGHLSLRAGGLAVLVQTAMLLLTGALARVVAPGRSILIPIMAGCVALGTSVSVIFLLAGANGDFLAFVLLTLYLASSLAFEWGWRPAAVLLAATVAVWLVVLPYLPVQVPAVELVGAVVAGSGLSLVIAEAYGRGFRRAITRERERDLTRARERAALEKAEQARAVAEEATRTRDRFLAIVSHDLRGPLGTAFLWAQLLRQGRLDDGGLRRALESLERNLRMSLRLIEDLVDVSRIASGKLHLEMGDVDLRTVVSGAADSARFAVQEKGIGLAVRLPDRAVPVRGDAVRLQQVVENLVTNAIKFTPDGGHVEVDLRREPQGAELVVRDTGVGIASNVLPHVFEAFRQAEVETDRRHGGLGLGLAIARQIVEAHGAAIEAESEGQGRGAVFRIRFPADEHAHM